MHPYCIQWLAERGIKYQQVPCPVFERWVTLQRPTH